MYYYLLIPIESVPPRNSLRSQQWIATSDALPDDQFSGLRRITIEPPRQEFRSRSSVFYSSEPYFSAATASPQQHPGHTPTHNFKQTTTMFESHAAPSSSNLSEGMLRNRSSGYSNGNSANNLSNHQTHVPEIESSSPGRFSFFRKSPT